MAAAAVLSLAPGLRGENAADPAPMWTVDSIMRGPKLVGYPQPGSAGQAIRSA